MFSALGRWSANLLLALGLMTTTAQAQPVSEAQLLIIYDSSNSMWGELADGSRKYEAGRLALAAVLGQGLEGRDIGFRAYGHRRRDDCRDSELVVPFTGEDAAGLSISEAATAIRPTGMTPITYSLTEGLADFGDAPGEILLISDGVETCDADPCALMAEWQDRDVDVRVHVVGVGLSDVERAAMACIADTSGGSYFDADSAEGFVTALQDVGQAIETAAAAEPLDTGEPDPDPDGLGFSIIYRAVDAAGREYSDAEGQLFLDGQLVLDQTTAQGRGRNVVDGPGEYELVVGVVLNDGTLYEPQRFLVSVTEPGETIVDVTLPAPARAEAVFTENGEPHLGDLVFAYQDGVEVFRFRAQDTALARPGAYEFRTTVNADNTVVTGATLVADQTTTVAFELVQTVRVYINFELPDGTELTRNSSLWQDGEEVYSVHSSNGADVRPGTYEVRSEDQSLPFTPTLLTIDAADGTTYTLEMLAGWVTITYADEPENYFLGRVPNRAQLHSLDRGGWDYSSPATVIAVAPGSYEIRGFENDGAFAPVPVTIENNQSVEVTLTPVPLGELVVTYAASDNYEANPDRAFVSALDGQPLPSNGFMRPGEPLRVVPGRYLVTGRGNAGDIPPVEVVVTEGAVSEVTLRLAGDPSSDD